MKKILTGLVFSLLITGCINQNPSTEAIEEKTPPVVETEKTIPVVTPPKEETALPIVSEEVSEEPIVLDEEKGAEEDTPVGEESEEIPATSTEEVLEEEEETGCVRKGAMCCIGEDCKGLAITCALGTTPELIECDENCMLQAECKEDSQAEETEPPFTENGECVFQDGMCCQGNLCAGIALNCTEGSIPTVTKCDQSCVPEGECKTQ